MAVDPATMTTAVAGAVVAIGGLVVSKRGQQDTRRQQEAADAVAKDRLQLEETQQALDTYEKLTERLAGESRRHSDRAESLEAQLDKERLGRAEDRAAFALIEDRCRAQMTAMVEGIAMLRATLVSEIAHSAADSLVGSLDPHPHDGSQPTPQLPTQPHNPDAPRSTP